jgi:hypothetical protein
MGLNLTGIVFLSLAVSCGIVSALLAYQQIGEVNRKLHDDEQIPYLFMYPGKMQRINAEYRRLYPDGRVDFWCKAFEVAMFVFLGLTAVALRYLK